MNKFSRTQVTAKVRNSDVPELMNYMRDHLDRFDSFAIYSRMGIAERDPERQQIHLVTSPDFAVQMQQDLADLIARWEDV